MTSSIDFVSWYQMLLDGSHLPKSIPVASRSTMELDVLRVMGPAAYGRLIRGRTYGFVRLGIPRPRNPSSAEDL